MKSTADADGRGKVIDAHSIDLSDPDLFANGDPHRVFGWLRANAPVFWNPRQLEPGFWALSRYSDVVAAYKDSTTFSSERGSVLGASQSRGEPGGGKMLALTDPPRHTRMRRLISEGFTPRMVKRLEPTIRLTAAELLSNALERDMCEFVSDVAARLPLAVICDLMGVPRSDWAGMFELTSRAFGKQDPKGQSEAHQEILLYYLELADDRRHSKRDDLVSVLVHGEIDGVPLEEEEILLNCDNLIIGGTEAVRHAVAGGLYAFILHPEEWDRLRESPELIPSAIEEILRWTSAGAHVLRTATRDVMVGSELIGEGDAVTLWNISANRDEAIFDDPDQFCVARKPNKHVALGLGPHFCLGGALARLELQVLLEELLARVDRVELAGPIERIRSVVVYGFESLPVVLHESH